ncbi:MAG: energy-coupling factor transporter transmembrane protein EcfT [Actinobacteria bacterium]|nr:energy-coupling factor transporter transmembrane protein EcfT [Actinomycetota bacterium]
MHPGGWLAWSACAGLAAVSTTNPFYLLPLAAGACAVHLARSTSSPGARLFRLFGATALVVIATRTLLVVLGPISAGSIVAASLEGLRVATLIMIYGAFNSVADPHSLLRLAPRRLHEPALAATLALTMAPRFIESAARVREAQRMRGIEVSALKAIPVLAVPLLETGMEQALTLAESMDARGHGRGPRSRYRPQPFGAWAWATVLVSALALVVVMAAGGAALTVVAFPLAWPTASPWLVAAFSAFAAPAFFPEGVPR